MRTRTAILGCILIVSLCSCSNKSDILQGSREKIDGIAYGDMEPQKAQSTEIMPKDPKSQELSSDPQVLWWRSGSRTPLESNIIIVNSQIFYVDGKGYLNCLDVATGQLIFKELVAEQPKGASFAGGICESNGVVYVCTNINSLVAFDISKKKILWIKTFDDMLKSRPVDAGNLLLVSSIKNQIYALNKHSGQVIWASEPRPEPVTMLRLGTSKVLRDKVLNVTFSGDIAVRELSTGKVVWADTLVSNYFGNSGVSIPTIAMDPLILGNKVCIANAFSQMAMYDLESGVLLWTKNIGVVSHPIVSNGQWIYVLSDRSVACLSAKDGEIQWCFDLKTLDKPRIAKRVLWYGPLTINDQIWLFNDLCEIVKLDKTSGKYIETQYKHHVRFSDTPVVHEGKLIARVDNRLCALG